MNREQLKRDIARATDAAWPDFAAEHPALAQFIRQVNLNECVTRSLADDEAFLRAYRAAVDAHVGQQALTHLVGEFVVPALRRLF